MPDPIAPVAPAPTVPHAELAGVTEHARALRRIVRLHAEVRRQMRLSMGLKDTDYGALALLLRRPLGPTELAHELHLTTAATTAVVDRLVAAGHAVREPHPADRRRTVVHADDRSREQAMAEVQHMVALVGESLEGTDDAERAAALRFLERVAAHMEDWRDDLARRVAAGAGSHGDEGRGRP